MMRIHRAIGWGMPYREFIDTSLLDLSQVDDPASCLGDELDNLLGDFRGLVAPMGFDKIVTAPDDHPGSLIVTAGNMDENEYVLIFPDDHYHKRWMRVDDTLDWEFSKGENGDQPVNQYHVLDHVPYPFSISHDPFPPKMFWWLTHCGILSPDDIPRLKPMRAEWWT